MKHLNKNHDRYKNSTIYTPETIVDFLHNEIIPHVKSDVVFDPAIGEGALTNRLKSQGSYIIGNDIYDVSSLVETDELTNLNIEDMNDKIDCDLIIMNPPFNGHPRKKLYPEVFIDKCFELCGVDTPIIAVIPSGYRINQRIKSKRWRKVRDDYNITSIVTLPLNIFDGVLFHTEILIFNIEGLKPHYFLDI